ncbi:MAG: phospholipase D-like domain-containing protein [Steroidobacteraceae bacterium]
MTQVSKRSRLPRILLLLVLGAWAGIGWWHTAKPLPPGTHVAGALQPVDEASLQLLTDLTAVDLRGVTVIEQSIHARVLERIRSARDFLVLDYFLFNDQPGPSGVLRYQNGIQPVASQTLDALLALRAREPALPILVLIDPINGYYRGIAPEDFAPLSQAGIDVVVVDLDPLRDSNPLYSSLWRLAFQWWLAPGVQGGWGNPLDAAGPSLPLSAVLRIPHFKADHRKVLITGDGAGSLVGMVSSANPHDASSAHSNVALELHGEALRPLLQSEVAIAQLSGWQGTALQTAAAQPAPAPRPAVTGDARAAILTEGAIADALLAALAEAGAQDRIDIAQFYLSDRHVIDALLAASRRGAAIRLVLDPNKDAFGFEKSGLPNRLVASELVAASDGAIKLRWYRTHGEQFHAKVVAIRRPHQFWLCLGSANFTRRNLDDYNLEANVLVTTAPDSALDRSVEGWFDSLWFNRPGRIEYTADSDLYADPSQGRYWLYRFMEATGLSTF